MADNHSDFVAVVRRRDYAGQYCMACDEGLYDARSEDMIQCSDCGDCLPRWMTKAEYAAFQHELEDEETTLDGEDATESQGTWPAPSEDGVRSTA